MGMAGGREGPGSMQVRSAEPLRRAGEPSRLPPHSPFLSLHTAAQPPQGRGWNSREEGHRANNEALDCTRQRQQMSTKSAPRSCLVAEPLAKEAFKKKRMSLAAVRSGNPSQLQS